MSKKNPSQTGNNDKELAKMSRADHRKSIAESKRELLIAEEEAKRAFRNSLDTSFSTSNENL